MIRAAIWAGLLLGLAATAAGAADGPTLLPRPAETGKSAIPPPAAAPPPAGDSERCPPALPCGTRLLGKIQKNGAVELQVPALRW